MTEVTLTDRYIDATVRSVPERQRADLSAELRSSIADQIEARVEGGADPAEAERAVLTALGDPTASLRSTPTAPRSSSGRGTSSCGGGC